MPEKYYVHINYIVINFAHSRILLAHLWSNTSQLHNTAVNVCFILCLHVRDIDGTILIHVQNNYKAVFVPIISGKYNALLGNSKQ